MSSISLFDIINVAVLWLDLNTCLCIPAPAADAARVNPNGPKTLLDNGSITFFINDNPALSNGLRRLPRNPTNSKLHIIDKYLAKSLQRFETYLLVNRILWGKLVLSLKLPIILDGSLKTTSNIFFIAYFNLLSCEFKLWALHLNYCFESFYIDKN